MVDALVNWFLSLVEAVLDLIPDWDPTLPDLSGYSSPLAEVNYLVALDVPWSLALAVLVLGPGFLFVKLSLWVIGLFTPSSTSPA